MSANCTFEELPLEYTAHVRVRTPVDKLPELIGRSYGQIMALIQQWGLKVSGPLYTAYFNLDKEDLDVEIGFPVDTSFDRQGEIRPGEIAAGTYATCFHKGLYSEMEPTYKQLTDWIEEQGAVPTGIAYEFYLNSPDEVPESELLTKILLPIQSD